MTRHFLSLGDLTDDELQALLARGAALATAVPHTVRPQTLAGRVLGLVFEKPSTRTYVSCAAAMAQLGGHCVTLDVARSQMARGEPLKDTAQVLSGYLDAVVFRTTAAARLRAFAQAATVPVVNGLTDDDHPLQILADLLTLQMHFGRLRGLTVAFVGDGSSNMAHAWIAAAGRFGFSLRIGTPVELQPRIDIKAWGASDVQVHPCAQTAVVGADVVSTDVWTSMGQETDAARKKLLLAPFAVTQALLALACAKAVVLHCLPAHRGEEIDADVLDGPQSLVLTEAKNRLFMSQALLEFLILGDV